MEIEALIIKMKEIHTQLLDSIDATDDSDDEYLRLIKIFDEKEILQNQREVRLLFRLISNLASNHHRTPDIFDKFEKILQYLIKDIPSPMSYYIPDYTKCNKLILYLLLGKGFLKPDEALFKKIYIYIYIKNEKIYR